MRVLHCLSQIPGRTGSGVFLQAMVREAAAAGHRQALVCGLPAAMEMAGELPEIPVDDIYPVFFETPELPFPVTGMSDVMPYESSLFSDFDQERRQQYELAFSRILRRAVDRFRPDIIHSHHLWLMSGLIRRLFPEIPLVVSVHGTELRQLELSPQLAPTVIENNRLVDRVMVLNQEQRLQVIRKYSLEPTRVQVTGTGYRRDLFCGDFCAKDENITLVYAGKLSRAKGVPWLLEVFDEIRREENSGPAIRLLMAGGGGGPEAEEIRRQAAAIDGVELLGPLSQAELAGLFQSSHLLVLPSFYEGLPLVLLEALACQCRLVVTDLPGISDLLGPAAINRELVSLVSRPPLTGPDQLTAEHAPSFKQELAAALRRQLQLIQEQKFICCENLSRTLTAAGWDQVFARVSEIYQNVFANAGKARNP